MIIIKRSKPTVSRGITPHYDRKGKYSQKRIRESTILKSKVHLATSGSRVWPVTIFNTGLTKILVHLTNGSPFKKRFSNRPIKSLGSNFDSGYMNGNVIGSARSKDLTAWARGLSPTSTTSLSTLLVEDLWHPGYPWLNPQYSKSGRIEYCKDGVLWFFCSHLTLNEIYCEVFHSWQILGSLKCLIPGKIHTHPIESCQKFLVEGVLKAKISEAKYEAVNWNFLGEVGGGVWILSGTTQLIEHLHFVSRDRNAWSIVLSTTVFANFHCWCLVLIETQWGLSAIVVLWNFRFYLNSFTHKISLDF